jgi:hypothetical protein
MDDIDREHSGAIEECGMRAVVTGTIMQTESDKVGLAREIVELIAGWST